MGCKHLPVNMSEPGSEVSLDNMPLPLSPNMFDAFCWPKHCFFTEGCSSWQWLSSEAWDLQRTPGGEGKLLPGWKTKDGFSSCSLSILLCWYETQDVAFSIILDTTVFHGSMLVGFFCSPVEESIWVSCREIAIWSVAGNCWRPLDFGPLAADENPLHSSGTWSLSCHFFVST